VGGQAYHGMTMAQNIVIRLRADMRFATPVCWALYPLVWMGILSPERAVRTGMRFVRIIAERE